VNGLTGGLGQLSRQRKITYIRGTAGFLDNRSLEIVKEDGGTDTLAFEHAIIATGSHPAKVPGLSSDNPRVMDSTSALELPEIPSSLLVVGGGYIGLELGSVYAALGTKVTVVEMMPGLLPGADRDLVNVLAKRIEAICEAVHLNTRVAGMRVESSGVSVTFEAAGASDAPPAGAREQTFDRVLVSVGRKPNPVPGIERTRVVVNGRGFVEVDEKRQTAEPTIYAIGDVVGEPMLAHKASHEGRVAVEAIAGHKAVFAPLAIPAVVFTDPELAWCGLTESDAQRDKREVTVARFPWGASGRSLTLDRTDGMTKLLLDPRTERILGVGIVGPGAGELIAEGVLAVEMGANATDLKLSIHPHPTLSETLMESAEVFFGHATHVYRPRRK
jgi:dihydrolipoamide dehydrogenase